MSGWNIEGIHLNDKQALATAVSAVMRMNASIRQIKENTAPLAATANLTNVPVPQLAAIIT